jgi:hypothetical protein
MRRPMTNTTATAAVATERLEFAGCDVMLWEVLEASAGVVTETWSPRIWLCEVDHKRARGVEEKSRRSARQQ